MGLQESRERGDCWGNNRIVSKSREIFSLLGETPVGGGEGVMTRARKRSIIKEGGGERGVVETVVIKMHNGLIWEH